MHLENGIAREAVEPTTRQRQRIQNERIEVNDKFR